MESTSFQGAAHGAGHGGRLRTFTAELALRVKMLQNIAKHFVDKLLTFTRALFVLIVLWFSKLALAFMQALRLCFPLYQSPRSKSQALFDVQRTLAQLSLEIASRVVCSSEFRALVLSHSPSNILGLFSFFSVPPTKSVAQRLC